MVLISRQPEEKSNSGRQKAGGWVLEARVGAAGGLGEGELGS